MPKFSLRGLMAATLALFMGLAALATPQLAAAQTVSPQTSSSTPTTGCTTGCPGTSQVGVVTMGGIQGSFMGAFGAFNHDGDPVADDTLTGEVEGYKIGEVHAMGEVTLSGPACVTCAQTGVNAKVTAWEKAGVSVMLSGSKPGVTYGGANSATVGTVGAIGTIFQPYVAPTTTPHPAN